MLNLVNNELIEQLLEHQCIILRVKDFIRDIFVASTPSALSQELRRTVPCQSSLLQPSEIFFF